MINIFYYFDLFSGYNEIKMYDYDFSKVVKITK